MSKKRHNSVKNGIKRGQRFANAARLYIKLDKCLFMQRGKGRKIVFLDPGPLKVPAGIPPGSGIPGIRDFDKSVYV